MLIIGLYASRDTYQTLETSRGGKMHNYTCGNWEDIFQSNIFLINKDNIYKFQNENIRTQQAK